MSGGFFRGTSADQDTRFSNKQAKLLKSQKFAPELDHLVDIRKVKMDVVKPWIATRVTEFLGFEDEVLIYFIYGLLEGKEINGKEVQIQLTGFMEKNTGKFMKELWNLLRSAEQNASGVPQQFLDAKEEEIKNKKVEADRITLEIQKKRDIAQEKAKEMDGEVDKTRSQSDGFNPLPKRLPPIGEEDVVSEERNGLGGKNRKQSRSMSRSPPRRRSISPDRRYRSPNRRSISPRRRHSPRRYRSPLRRRSPYSRRRSTSRSRRKSPSPVRRRSPFPARRRSPSPARRRSPSPVRRRSPISLRRRSPSPSRRSSPSLVRRRSPSPVRRRSPPPMRRRSPSPRRRRSPSPFQRRSRRRSPSPRRRSPSPFRRRSPSPLGSISPPRRSLSPISPPRRSLSPISPKESKRSPLRSPQQRNRSRSPYRSRSPVRSRRSLSRDREIRTNGVGSKRTRDDYPSQRSRGKRSPVRHTLEREEVELSDQERKALDSVSRRPPVPSRSPHRDPKKQSGVHHQIPVRLRSPEKSPGGSESPPDTRIVISRDGKRTSSPSQSPVRVTQEQRSRAESASPVRKVRDQGARHRGSPETSGEEDNSHARRHVRLSPRKRTRLSPSADAKTNVPSRNTHDEKYSPEDSVRVQSGDIRSRHADDLESRKKDRDVVGHGMVEAEKSELDDIPDEKPFSKKRSRSSNFEGSEQGDKVEALQKPTKKVDHQIATSDSGSEESEKYRTGAVDKRKQKKSERHQMASSDDASDDSQIDTKKDAKRRRKEEKRLRKEEKRRRREERHRKKEERRAGRQKTKTKDTASLDIKKNQKFGDDDIALRTESHPSDTEEDIDPKQHEIELRKKALESLKRKKAINS